MGRLRRGKGCSQWGMKLITFIINASISWLEQLLTLSNYFQEVKNYLMKLINSVDGLLGIAVTDRDGVPLLKASTDQAPELALRPTFLSTFGTAVEQANKIGFQQCKNVICMYQNYQVVQINKSPVVITFIADSNTNTGLLLNLETDMNDMLNEVSKVVTVS